MPVLPLGEVLLPGLPIVFWPAGGHAAVILRGDVDVDQVDPAAAGGFGELQNEDGIGVAFLEHHGAPGLDDDFVRDEQEIMAGEGAAPGGESRGGCHGKLKREKFLLSVLIEAILKHVAPNLGWR